MGPDPTDGYVRTRPTATALRDPTDGDFRTRPTATAQVMEQKAKSEKRGKNGWHVMTAAQRRRAADVKRARRNARLAALGLTPNERDPGNYQKKLALARDDPNRRVKDYMPSDEEGDEYEVDAASSQTSESDAGDDLLAGGSDSDTSYDSDDSERYKKFGERDAA